jgi:hypothetical protein
VLERLIAALDALDTDADFEPSLAAPERSPRAWGFRSVAGDGSQMQWADGETSDGEESGGDDEPDDHDEDDGIREPTLGSPEIPPMRLVAHGTTWLNLHGNQEHWADGRAGDHEREDENEHGGDILDEPHDEMDEEGSESSLGRPESLQQSMGLSAPGSGDNELNGNIGAQSECYADVFGREGNWRSRP